MTHICCTPSLPALAPPRSGHVRRFTRRLAPVLAPALVLAALGCREDAESPTAPEPEPALAATASAALAFYQVSAGETHTCGVTTGHVAYCWGWNYYGQLGDGTTTTRLKPKAVQGGLRFRQVSAGDDFTCGVSYPDDRAYCWGHNWLGQLGDGTTTDRLTAVAVVGGRLFRQVEAGGAHACAVSAADQRVYCWGFNYSGQLGDGTTADRPTPTAVLGGRAYRRVSAGGSHTCAVTPTDVAYCWGLNYVGQLGDGTEVSQRLQPTRVAGGYAFRQVDAGWLHTCGVTTGDRAFCWGDGSRGQIGDGKTYLRFTPRAVAGGLSLDRVTAGATHSCGVTTNSRAYCWGANYGGQLGDGTTTNRLTPVRVLGGLSFGQVSAGHDYTCGVTTAAAAYCWGGNSYGQLGDGTTTNRLKPRAVVGPS